MSYPRHMTSADEFPQKTPGKVRVYYMQYCPYALRANLTLTKKGIDYEKININLKDKPSWFLEKYGPATVPVLEIDDKVIGESLVIAEFVDEFFPGEKFLPTDPYERAKAKMLLSNEFPKAITSIYGLLRRKPDWEEGFSQHVGKLEKLLESNTFFSGNEIGYADYMIYPWIRYIGLRQTTGELNKGQFPKVDKWLEEMKKDDTVRKCDNPPDLLLKFLPAYYSVHHVGYDFD